MNELKMYWLVDLGYEMNELKEYYILELGYEINQRGVSISRLRVWYEWAEDVLTFRFSVSDKQVVEVFPLKASVSKD
jgi:hypothetical protein